MEYFVINLLVSAAKYINSSSTLRMLNVLAHKSKRIYPEIELP